MRLKTEALIEASKFRSAGAVISSGTLVYFWVWADDLGDLLSTRVPPLGGAPECTRTAVVAMATGFTSLPAMVVRVSGESVPMATGTNDEWGGKHMQVTGR